MRTVPSAPSGSALTNANASTLWRGLGPLAAAALYALALPPFGLAFLGWLATAPLVAWLPRRPGAAALHGLAFGTLFGFAVAGWLGTMVADYFESPSPGRWLAVLALFAGTAGAPLALACAVWTRLGRSPIAFGAAFALAEALRALGPLPNPFALLATTQVPLPAALQATAVVGPFGLAWAMASTGAVLGLAARERGLRRRAESLAVVAIAGLGVAGGALRLASASAPDAVVSVALVQAGRPALRPGEPGVEAELDAYLTPTREAAADGAELVLWPEMAAGFDLFATTRERIRLGALARELGIDLVFGGLGREPDSSRWANRVHLLRAGTWAGHYDKRLLMPFAETPWPPDPDAAGGFAPGTRDAPLRASAARLGVLLCSEAAHPSRGRAIAAAGATLLINPSNDAWFPSAAAARQQLQNAALRAVETGRPMLRPTTNGWTAVIDRFGRIRAELPRDVPGVLRDRVAPSSGSTPYLLAGDAPILVLAMVVLALSWLRRPRAD